MHIYTFAIILTRVSVYIPLQPDPEARPTIEELIYFTQELLIGQPLPPYELSEEAQSRRQARLRANTLVTHKKVPQKDPHSNVKQREGVSIGGAAMKRLMEKRGGGNAPIPITTTPTPTPTPTHSSSPVRPKAKPAASQPIPQPVKQSTSNTNIAFDANFDFGDDFLAAPTLAPAASAQSNNNSVRTSFNDTQYKQHNEPIVPSKNAVDTADFLFDEADDPPSYATSAFASAHVSQASFAPSSSPSPPPPISNSSKEAQLLDADDDFFASPSSAPVSASNSTPASARVPFTDPFSTASLQPISVRTNSNLSTARSGTFDAFEASSSGGIKVAPAFNAFESDPFSPSVAPAASPFVSSSAPVSAPVKSNAPPPKPQKPMKPQQKGFDSFIPSPVTTPTTPAPAPTSADFLFEASVEPPRSVSPAPLRTSRPPTSPAIKPYLSNKEEATGFDGDFLDAFNTSSTKAPSPRAPATARKSIEPSPRPSTGMDDLIDIGSEAPMAQAAPLRSSYSSASASPMPSPHPSFRIPPTPTNSFLIAPSPRSTVSAGAGGNTGQSAQQVIDFLTQDLPPRSSFQTDKPRSASVTIDDLLSPFNNLTSLPLNNSTGATGSYSPVRSTGALLDQRTRSFGPGSPVPASYNPPYGSPPLVNSTDRTLSRMDSTGNVKAVDLNHLEDLFSPSVDDTQNALSNTQYTSNNPSSMPSRGYNGSSKDPFAKISF